MAVKYWNYEIIWNGMCIHIIHIINISLSLSLSFYIYIYIKLRNIYTCREGINVWRRLPVFKNYKWIKRRVNIKT